MPSIPVPCTNCLRFHYGACREAPKQCYQCGGFNHIRRYCPRGRRVPIDWRGPLPGTGPWCEMFDLNGNPQLKRKVLDALKSSPDCPIWVGSRCIYAGNERHFTRDEPMKRGRTLADRIMRDRSRSPLRGRTLKRSRSPSQRNGNQPDRYGRQRSPNPNERYHTRSYFQSYEDYLAYSDARQQSPRQIEQYRSRTPLRQHPSTPRRNPPRQHLSRKFASGSNAVLIESRNSSNRTEKLNKSISLPTNITTPLPKLAPMAVPAQVPLGEVTNVSRSTAAVLPKPVIQNTATIANTAVQRFQLPNQQSEPLVEDPYFVLGVSEGATESE
jgi:hypothetical protein